MPEERNRVIEGMQRWKEKEQQIAELFSVQATKTRYFEKLKLDHYYELARSIRNPTRDEKMMKRILEGEIDRLAHRLYPSPLVRFIASVIRVLKALFKPRAGAFQELNLDLIKPVDKKEQQAKLAVQKSKVARPVLLETKQTSLKKGLGR